MTPVPGSTAPVPADWLLSKSERGNPRTVLDVVMVISVVLALTCFGVWFFLFAEGGGI